MSESPASWLRKLPLPDDFKRGLEKTGGSFSFDTDDMLELGEVYFELYPGAAQHRNNDQVLAGYEIVRIAVFEKMMEEIPLSEKENWWRILKKSSEIEQQLRGLLKNSSIEELASRKSQFENKLKTIQRHIEALPRGEVRERFMGGVAVFPNTLYLLRLALEKLTAEKGQS